MAMWCNISLQPVIEAYAAAITLYSHINITHMGVGPTTVNATAARIAETMQALYHVIVNQSLVTEQLISAFSKQLSTLAGQPLSPQAQLYWNKQLQDIQLQNSLSSIKMLTDELSKEAPSLQPYIEALEKAVRYFISNAPLLQNSSTSQDLLKQTAMIFLTSANITTGDIFSTMLGNISGLNEASIINTMREVVKLMTELKLLGDDPMVYQALEQILASNDTALIVRKVLEMTTWLGSTRASGLDLLMQVLHRMYDILRSILSLLTKLGVQMPENSELFKDLAGNVIAMLRQLLSTPGLLSPMHQQLGMSRPEMTGGNHSVMVRHRREALMMPMRDPMDDFIDLFFIDYPSMFRAISVPPTSGEILETVHMFFANPDLSVVLKGVTRDVPWGLNASREETINAALEGLSFFTLSSAFQMSSMDLLTSAVDKLPDAIPFSPVLKNITRILANESQEILMLMQQVIQTATELFQSNMTDQQLSEKLTLLRSQVCALEDTETMHQLLWFLSIERGQLCGTILPSLQILAESLMINASVLTDAVFQSFIGEPKNYNIQSNWTSMLGQGLDTSSLRSLNINVTSPGEVTVGELLRDKADFVQDVQRHMDFDPAALQLLMDAVVPNNNLEILSWLVNLRQCTSTSSVNMKASDAAILKTFCSMSVEQWYSFSLLMVRHLNMEKVIYRVVLSEDMQSLVVVMLQMAESLTEMMNNILPTINKLQSYLLSIEDLNLMANQEFNLMSRGYKRSISSKATFVTLSRALCSNGIMALFGISKLPPMSEPNPDFPSGQQREEMIERFKIPRNATPFCMNMYLDMVNTTGGAIAWAFLKPMLMGQILYTPDTPITRAIMEKANATLQEFANLRKNSQDWIQSSDYIINSAELLSHTLPMLQNSLSNSFVKNFIEMQTDIDVDRMKDTLSSFSNMSVMLEKNKHILSQITTLSTLMVDLSSCIKFDRYRGYDSAKQLNNEAQELAKNRNLYASVIFKLPKDDDSSKNRHARSSSNASSLPPQVSYTIRMHMDNVMRTDRVRDPYFVKDTHLLARQTMRYNRGFVYLQENIDRAIIESQTGKRVTEPSVQLQPFPYPCHLRDEYLEAISFVFPIMLMLAWVLFIADFVKKLVHERELRLHEYMKMMGVNPLSHFFAWFVECATYLVLTIVILTLVLKYGKILPNSDSFLMFLYLCDYGLSIIAFSYLVSSFFDKTYIAGLSGSLLYILCFFPFIVVMAMETNLTFSQKSALSLFSPTCFSYASQYVSRYEAQGEGIQWSNSYTSPIAGDTASFGWLCWLMFIDSTLYFTIGAYIRMVFPGKYGIPSPWYFPFKASFWADLCCCIKSKTQTGKGLLFNNIMQKNPPVFPDNKEKGKSTLSFQAGEDFSELPVGVALHGLNKMYSNRVGIQNLNVSFHEGHVTSLLGHNGAGKTTTMSLLTGLFAPTSGTIEVYGRDMQTNIDDIRKDLGVCMQYDVLFEHMTTKEHLLLYSQIKAPHWSRGELREQVRTILEETGMYVHRHKRVGTLSGGMKRKLSISIAFIGGSRLVVLDEPTTGVDPCSRRSIWDIVIQHKKNRTIIMSTHHLDEAEVLSDRIAFLESGGLKCCGSPFHLKDKLGQGYKLTLTKKLQNLDAEAIDSAELKEFIQAHVPEARLKEAQGGDLVYSLPPFTSANASSYRSLLTALDSNLDTLQLGGYGISDTTLEEVFLQLTHDNTESDSVPLSISETISDTGSVDSFPSDNGESLGDKIKLTGSSIVSGMALAWLQISAILVKRFHHSRRDWKGLIAQILLPVLFVIFAMGMGSIRSDLRHYPELELSPALYNIGPSYSFFRNQNPSSGNLVDSMMSYPGIDNACLDRPNNPVCGRNTYQWSSRGNSSKGFSICKCTRQEQVCDEDNYQPPHRSIASSQVVYNLSGINVENYLVATANDFIRNRYGGFDFGMRLPTDLQMDLRAVPKNRTLSKVWFNPEGHHTMPAYLNSLNNLILRSNLPADKDPREYAISVSSHPYFGRPDDEDAIIQGMLQILVAVCVLTGYSITTASFAIYEVHEHHSGSKRLQHIAGISEPFYWAVNFLYDMVIYLIPVTLTICVVAAFQVPAFTDRQNLGAVALLLVLFGFSTFPWMYLLSGVFKDAEMAFITYVCINLFISVNTIMSTSILYFLGQISVGNSELINIIFERLSYAFLIFPQFNFGNGLLHLARKNIEVQILSGYGVDAYQNPFSTDALGWMFLSSFIQGVVFFTLRLLLNKFLLRKVRHLICGRKTLPRVAGEDEDEDVAAEHLRVSSGAANMDILQVNQLTKIYQHLKRKVPAVKRLSVGIPAGECFGLLGVNGAGKTTTFKMLTGDVSPTDGTAQIRDWDGRLVDIMDCRSKGINIGYCPQEDALDNLLTGEEHLYFYACIRGIPKRDRERVVNYLLKRLELSYHRNIITEGYSCGTRRKLSTALALIGHPQILLLDEPSSGMDPRTKRHLWKIISEEVKGKCAVVLTSHSMEECEALCSRLAIMDKGQFRCLGSLQHIKNRFGSGFTVRMYLAEASCDADAITGFMQRRFPSTYLKDQHSTMVEYHVPVAPGGVADIFDQLESNKNALQIKHFSVSQTTLDEVFINFAMGKIGMETIPIHSEEEECYDLDCKKAVDA
nr:PREDICTED: ATP-binding cassette sub-family A member 12 [Paralichthys olivaceus]